MHTHLGWGSLVAICSPCACAAQQCTQCTCVFPPASVRRASSPPAPPRALRPSAAGTAADKGPFARSTQLMAELEAGAAQAGARHVSLMEVVASPRADAAVVKVRPRLPCGGGAGGGEARPTLPATWRVGGSQGARGRMGVGHSGRVCAAPLHMVRFEIRRQHQPMVYEARQHRAYGQAPAAATRQQWLLLVGRLRSLRWQLRLLLRRQARPSATADWKGAPVRVFLQRL